MTEVHLNGQDAYSTYNQDNKIKKIQRADEFKVPVYTHSQMERPEKFGSNVGREAVASAVKPVFEQGGAIILNNLKVEVASSLGFGNSNINKENNYNNNSNNDIIIIMIIIIIIIMIILIITIMMIIVTIIIVTLIMIICLIMITMKSMMITLMIITRNTAKITSFTFAIYVLVMMIRIMIIVI